jgi:hypothetical protein
MASLEPCPSCRRHVRRDQTRCPFCDAVISFEGVPERAPLRGRLCRAAIAGLAAAAATTAGCSCAAPAGVLDGAIDGELDASRDMGPPDAASPYRVAPDGALCWGYGPDTGYGTPPWGYCCVGPDTYGACPDPYPDAGDASVTETD